MTYPTKGTVTGEGAVEFDQDITFNEAGVYTFKLTEQDDTENHPEYSYDGTVYTLTYIVEEESGLLVVKDCALTKDGEAFDGDIVFTNEYTTNPGPGEDPTPSNNPTPGDDPVQSNDPTQSQDPTPGIPPKTGSSNHMGLVIILMVIAVLGIAACFVPKSVRK